MSDRSRADAVYAAGLGGAGLIGIALWSSIRWNRQNGAIEVTAH